MTEIRPIRPNEAETFLRLLCDVFELDYQRAHSIFFSEPLYDLSRKWALFEHGEMLSILTTVPLEFGWGRAIGIAGVATDLKHQRGGYAGRLLETVCAASREAGEDAVMLFAKDTRLYERLGFVIQDQVIRGEMVAQPEGDVPMSIELDQIRSMYDSWSLADPSRLRRDELRWKYWRWNLRVCTPLEDGYLCFEGGIIREVVVSQRCSAWVLPPKTEWLGLSTMAERLGVELSGRETELHLMSLNVPGTPQFFMTDQF